MLSGALPCFENLMQRGVQLTIQQMESFVTSAWSIWGERNARVHGKQWSSQIEVVAVGVQMLRNYQEARGLHTTTLDAPSMSMLKVYQFCGGWNVRWTVASVVA
ncbi:conserved hypothetical protein [Ricinus communis]|uniref:Uncharacterized protein n=1 Tax=Ricinus communis TaxID=3988 RepID=B9SLA1_RICCO|nr:conserved hypothetical protein [Ricinus communis]